MHQGISVVATTILDRLSDGKPHLRSELVYAVKRIIPPEQAMGKYRRQQAIRARTVLKQTGRVRIEIDRPLEKKILGGLSRYVGSTLFNWKRRGKIERLLINGVSAYRLKEKSKQLSPREKRSLLPLSPNR